MYFFYYIPVGINAEMRRFPTMTTVYSLMMVVVYLGVRFFPDVRQVDFYNLIYVPADAHWITAVGAAFLHLGWLHLVGNLVYLILFGRYVEDRMGPTLFTFLFLSSAGIGNYAQGVFNTHVLHNSVIGIIGASGAVSGLLGAFTVRFIRSKLQVAYWVFLPLQAYTRAGRSEIPSILAVAFWFVLQITRGLLQTGGVEPHVAYVTHIAGFAWGVLLAVACGQYTAGRVEYLHQLGDRYLLRGESYAAQGAYIRYLTHEPEDAQAYASLARAMVMSGNEVGAQKNYRQACEMLLDQRRRGEAEAVFREALRGYMLFVLSPRSHLDLAFGLERDLKPDLAVRAYENFEERYPTHDDAPFALLRAAGLYWNVLDKPNVAEYCYRKLIENYPGDRWEDFAQEQVRLLSLLTEPIS